MIDWRRPLKALFDLAVMVMVSALCSMIVLRGATAGRGGEPLLPTSSVEAAVQAVSVDRFPAGAMDELVRQVAVLRNDLARVQAELLELRRARRIAASQDTGSAAEEESTVETRMREALEDGARQQADRIRKIEAAMVAEEPDNEWAQRSAELIRSALEQLGFPPNELLDLDCRATLCRVELGFDNPSALQELGIKLPLAVGEALPEMTMQEARPESGSTSAVFYLRREGYDFPT